MRDVFRDGFRAAYPETMELQQAMQFARGMTHVWRWQQRDLTGCHPSRAGFEHVEKDDPYLLEIASGNPSFRGSSRSRG